MDSYKVPVREPCKYLVISVKASSPSSGVIDSGKEKNFFWPSKDVRNIARSQVATVQRLNFSPLSGQVV